MTSLAMAAGRRVVRGNGLHVDDSVALQSSNRLTVRLEPAAVIARIAPASKRSAAEREVDIVRRLEEVGAPVAPLDPRFSPAVHDAGDFVVTLWSPCEPLPPTELSPAEYARSLAQLHEGLRAVGGDGEWPVHVTDRVGQALALVDGAPDVSEVMTEADRELVREMLLEAATATRSSVVQQQLLHGEPHRDNLMRTERGLVYFDFETCCRGPVEFDIAHATRADDAPPSDVAGHYPGVDPELLRTCWRTALALAVAWRCEPGDDLPNGRARVRQWIRALRSDSSANG